MMGMQGNGVVLALLPCVFVEIVGDPGRPVLLVRLAVRSHGDFGNLTYSCKT